MLIRLKKYLNPHENSCSKVISILITVNILHESSSAPHQHNSVQYKMVCFVLSPRCFAYRHAAATFHQLQMGFEGRRQHARIQEFLSVLFSPQLILQLTEVGGPIVLLLRKVYLYFTKDPEGVHYFPGGGVSNFF